MKNFAEKNGFAALGTAPAINEVKALFGWAESVIVGIISYLPPESKPADNNPRGLIARVAQSFDYHEVMRIKLSRLKEELTLLYPKARFEICVDTNPLPERKLAVLAGVAWRGRNGNVFAEGCGSYISIGEIITDIKLSVSEVILNERCGSCGLCVKACPAQAIVGFGKIDTKRCVSALTQLSGVIPHEMTSKIGTCIYGCDACQEVCPQNAGICCLSADFPAVDYPGAYPEIIPLIKLTAHDYKTKLKSTSIGWIRRTRIRRNAAIAAGNLRCEEALPALAEMLEDENPVLRNHALEAIEKIKSK